MTRGAGSAWGQRGRDRGRRWGPGSCPMASTWQCGQCPQQGGVPWGRWLGTRCGTPALECDSRESSLQAAPLGPDHLSQRHERLPQEVLCPEHSDVRPLGSCHSTPPPTPTPRPPSAPVGPAATLSQAYPEYSEPPRPSHSSEPNLCPSRATPPCPGPILHPSGHPTPVLHPQSHPPRCVLAPSCTLPHQASHGPGSQGGAGAGVWWAPTFCQSPWGMERRRVG